jgi:hypothetical protein
VCIISHEPTSATTPSTTWPARSQPVSCFTCCSSIAMAITLTADHHQHRHQDHQVGLVQRLRALARAPRVEGLDQPPGQHLVDQHPRAPARQPARHAADGPRCQRHGSPTTAP